MAEEEERVRGADKEEEEERERGRDRQTDRQTDRQRVRDKQTDRQRERERDSFNKIVVWFVVLAMLLTSKALQNIIYIQMKHE